jgi:transcriptional regulator with XRE-family HTH domain
MRLADGREEVHRMSVVIDEARAAASTSQHLGELVRMERIRRDMRQDELAHRTGMTQADISALENGRKFVFRAPVTLLERLAGGLGEDAKEQGRLFRAMLLLSGLKPETLDAILTFDPAMNQERELVPA